MLRTLIFSLALLMSLAAGPGDFAYAQQRFNDIGESLSRLSNNPRYEGRVLGTHIRRRNGNVYYEVRILRPDDKVILVYLDPETGGVIGDSERSAKRQIRRALEGSRPGNRIKPNRQILRGFNGNRRPNRQ